ncbi:MAG: glutaredoxin family protein [Endomicrobia bacterium]|nr:glutaredoxin family protein [Endomicrobiia bacterium]MCL2506624.1 glutaredoxin family protein [Endomicrobiia bacterium]
MSVKHVAGKKSEKSVLLYALTTCPWCRKTKSLLTDLGIAYDYLDVDLLAGEEQDKAVSEVEAVNPQGGFPTLVINKTEVIVGYKPEEITAALA